MGLLTLGQGPVRWRRAAGPDEAGAALGFAQGGPGAGDVEVQREPKQAEARPVGLRSGTGGGTLGWPALVQSGKGQRAATHVWQRSPRLIPHEAEDHGDGVAKLRRGRVRWRSRGLERVTGRRIRPWGARSGRWRGETAGRRGSPPTTTTCGRERMKQGGEGQVREEEEGDGAPAWGSPARVVACEDLAGEEGSRSSGSYLLDEGRLGRGVSCSAAAGTGTRQARGAGLAGEEGSRRRGHRAPDRCEEGRPWRKKVARRRGRGGAPLLWIEQGGGGARWLGWARGSREIE